MYIYMSFKRAVPTKKPGNNGLLGNSLAILRPFWPLRLRRLDLIEGIFQHDLQPGGCCELRNGGNQWCFPTGW